MLQRTPEWDFDRAGMLTASEFAAAIGISPFKSRARLWREMTGRSERFIGNAASDWGTLHEEAAIEHYEATTGLFVDKVGFVFHKTIPYLGCSPDGLVGDDGSIEAKCPYSNEAHTEVPDYYMPQVQGVLEITNRQWCDFVSTKFVETEDDFFVRDQSVFRVERDPKYWEWMRPLLEEFWGYIERDEQPPRLKRKPNYEDYLICHAE